MSIKKLLLGLAVSGQVACGSAAGNENKHEAEGLQEAVEGSNAATDVFGVRTQVQERQTEIIAEAEALAEIEQSAWQKVVEATPEMVERDRVEELWTNPTPEFLEYMRLWDTHTLGMDPLYKHGLLNREIYEDYMNVVADYQEFSGYIHSIMDYVRTTNEFTAEQKERFLSIRADQLRLLSRMSEVIPSLPHVNNHEAYRQAIQSTMEQIEAARPENNHSYFSRSSASDPLLAEALIFIETLPTMPDGVPIELVRLHGIAMLEAGFHANAKLSISDLEQFINRLRLANSNDQTGLGTTKHVTSGFPHLTESTARNIFTFIYNNPNTWPYNQVEILGSPTDEDFVSRNFERVMRNINDATEICIAMMHDNRSRFADYINQDPAAVSFIRDPRNQSAFVAITAMFNNIGGTEITFEFAYNLLVESGYDADIFAQELGDPVNYEQWNLLQPNNRDIPVSARYVRMVSRMYEELLRTANNH